jgi:hypothetical protein
MRRPRGRRSRPLVSKRSDPALMPRSISAFSPLAPQCADTGLSLSPRAASARPASAMRLSERLVAGSVTSGRSVWLSVGGGVRPSAFTSPRPGAWRILELAGHRVCRFSVVRFGNARG